jgi:hypothetical protein
MQEPKGRITAFSFAWEQVTEHAKFGLSHASRFASRRGRSTTSTDAYQVIFGWMLVIRAFECIFSGELTFQGTAVIFAAYKYRKKGTVQVSLTMAHSGFHTRESWDTPADRDFEMRLA